MAPRRFLAGMAGFVLSVAGFHGGSADAHTCSASATAPVMNIDGTATGRGSFQCLVPDPGTLTLYVCVEVASAPSLWNSYGCTTTTRTVGYTVFGSATGAACSVPGGLLMRTTAYGVSDAGYHDYAESDPAVVNCTITSAR